MLNQLFKSKTESKKDSAFSKLSNIAAVAKADGKVDRSEMNVLYKAGKKYGLTKSEVHSVLTDKKAKVDFYSDNSEKFEYLYDLAETMMADGNLDSREMDHCLAMANRLGFRPAIVGVLVRHISSGVQNGLTKKEIKAKAEAYM